MKFRLNKYQKKLRYELSPYRKVYDNFEMDWLPSLMFLNKRNFRSKVCNTDIHGLRFNHRVNFKKTSIFNIKKK